MFTVLSWRTLGPIGPWHVLGPTATLNSFWTGAPQPPALCHIWAHLCPRPKYQLTLFIDTVYLSRQLLGQTVWPRNWLIKQALTIPCVEKLCDVFPATFGPHPWIGVIVERRGHHMLLVLGSILLAFVTVIVRHVEHMAKLMSDGESSTESIILINTATSVGITNCTQLSKT